MCDIMYSKCELALMRQHHEIICESSIFELVSIRNHHEKVIVRDSLTRFWRATYENEILKINEHPAEHQGPLLYLSKSFADIENLVRLSL